MEFSKAVRNVDIATVEKMVNYYCFEINGKEIDTSPLHWVAEAGQAEIIKWLISKGAKVLIENGADLNVWGGVSAVSGIEYKETPLIIASRNGNFEIVKLLVEHGADVNAISKLPEYPTPLFRAPARDRIKNLEILIAHDANLQIKNKKGQIALQFAENIGRKKAAEYLHKAEEEQAKKLNSKL